MIIHTGSVPFFLEHVANLPLGADFLGWKSQSSSGGSGRETVQSQQEGVSLWLRNTGKNIAAYVIISFPTNV
jgi:hypothetical protein